MAQLNVLEQISEFDNGNYNSPDVETQIKSGWYDWFCKDQSLNNKTKSLYKKVKQLVKTKRIQELNLESTYVWFKNNCPMNGSLYDDIRFADIETGDVLFTIVPRSGHQIDEGCRTQLHGNRISPNEDFQHDVYMGDWRGLVKFLNS